MESNSHSELYIISYNNFHSFWKKIDVIRCLLKKCDVLILQEILPLPDDISFTEGSDENLMCVSYRVDTQYSQSDFYYSRSKRGMAVFWNTKPQISVNICDPHDNFMLTNIPCDTFCLANIYMPCDDRAADSIYNIYIQGNFR